MGRSCTARSAYWNETSILHFDLSDNNESMGCSESKEVHVVSRVSMPGPRPTKPLYNLTSHTIASGASATNSNTINWAVYPELKPYRDEYFIDPEDVRVIRKLPSNYMTTEMGNWSGESVILKSVDLASSADEQAKSRKALMTEISSMARIDHPNIVGFKGFCVAPTKGLSCVTEYMEGGTLRSLLDNPKTFAKLTWRREKINFAIDICSALCYKHNLKPRLIHRNIKASKVLLSRDRTKAKLSGFGASRDRSFDQQMTNQIGEIQWSAPELIMEDEDYTEKVDVYSFGVLLTELDTGLIPFAGIKETMPSTAFTNKIVSGALRPTLSPECPEIIALVVKSCIQQDPHIRPSSERVLEMLHNAKTQLNEYESL
ncbi:hypothetical protein AeMF1_002616 [Aphanomyces euteiches]|nr:hypothetical protein AeMF1_002616 [Aphanomyces euteiches]